MAEFPAQHQAHQPGSEEKMYPHPGVISRAVAYLEEDFLASRDASYFTGQVLHPNGGYIVNA